MSHLFLLMKWYFIVCLVIKCTVLDIVFEYVFAGILWGMLWMSFSPERTWVCCQVSGAFESGTTLSSRLGITLITYPVAFEQEGPLLDTPLYMGLTFYPCISISTHRYLLCFKDALKVLVSVFSLNSVKGCSE